ncbi:hypothetical protein [Variovorax sp. PBS-H4]|uniref:hypothetical protein n=1 Tax=Variovorax sp. PBS-H4 TaxID=434008 RepID=UPI0013A5A9AF|nr:hypothetical protein [Variovorax sp. PBS-H4]
MPLPFRARVAPLVLVAAALGACSPVFNWREVPIADEGLVALLPCKPDRATRNLPLGGGSLSIAVDMTGCEAGGATFAVAHATAENPAQAEGWMRAWRSATRSQVAGGTIAETPATLPRAATSPAPVRLEVRQQVAGDPAPAQMLWFAQQRGGKMALYQATVLGSPASADAATVFFEGLRLP